jgi:hypothetical protein
MRDSIRQFKAAGVPLWCKQLGKNPVLTMEKQCSEGTMEVPYTCKDSHGGDWLEWPQDLRVRELPEMRED